MKIDLLDGLVNGNLDQQSPNVVGLAENGQELLERVKRIRMLPPFLMVMQPYSHWIVHPQDHRSWLCIH